MRRAQRVLAAVVLGVAGAAWGDTVVSVSTRAGLAGNDLIDWGSAGAALTNVSNPFTISSGGGLSVTVSQASGDFRRVDEGFGWGGNFQRGDHLLYTLGGGPITITFASPVSAAGAQIQTAFLGNFSGGLHATAFSPSGADLGTFAFSGVSTSNEDNSAVFIGIRDTSGANIKSIRFDVTSAVSSPEDFTINQVSLDVPRNAPVPTPSAVYGGGLLIGVLGVLSRKRRVLA